MRLLLSLVLAFSVAIPASASTLRPRTGAYELQVLVDGKPQRNFVHDGDTWLLGQLGQRYTLRVYNRSWRPVEAVVSVDGRDVIDGETASPQKGGYLVPARGWVDIDGWRISHQQAAAFRFSSVGQSYAAQMGSGREVGVIGVAIFEEKQRPPPPPPVSVVPRAEPSPESCCMSGRLDDSQPRGPTDSGRGKDGFGIDHSAPSAPSAQAEAPAMQPPADSMSAAAPSQGMPRAKSSNEPPAGLRDGAGQGDEYGVGGLGSRGTGSTGGSDNNGYAHAEVEKKKARSGLGTEYGEAVSSYIHEVAFERSSSRPAAVLGERYNDRDGLIALGIDVDGAYEQALRNTAEPFPVVERSFAQPPPGWNR